MIASPQFDTTNAHILKASIKLVSTWGIIKSNNSSNTDGSFTMADSNLWLKALVLLTAGKVEKQKSSDDKERSLAAEETARQKSDDDRETPSTVDEQKHEATVDEISRFVQEKWGKCECLSWAGLVCPVIRMARLSLKWRTVSAISKWYVSYLNIPWPVHDIFLCYSLHSLATINPCPAEPGKPCLCKQCRSRSVGFWRSQLIWICTVCH